MTECKRIVKDGIVPADFLNEETRCDFLVDSTRKKIWAIELDLLREFDSVCKKHNLKYYIAFGTLIGAVRHKGFIPWDDDVDVLMFRDDYQKLLSLYDSFRSPYFLQTPYTDKSFLYSFAKLSNDNTTFVGENFSYQGFHSGVFLDIFPLDSCVLEKSKEIYDRIKFLNLENSTYMRMKNPHLSADDQERVKNWRGIDPLQAYEEIQRLASQFNHIKTEHVALAVSTLGKYGRAIYPRVVYNETIYLEFENYKFPAPAGYDRLLRQIYGDYMQFPPPEERGTKHTNLIIEPDIPYEIALKQHHNNKK